MDRAVTASVTVIVNGSAGSQSHDHARLEALMRDAGLAPRILTLPGDGDVRALAADAISGAPRAVVAAGGDGTISSVAGALAGTGIPLGVLPFGTMNHFAKDLGIPLAVEDAVHVIAAGHTAEVDAGEVNGRIFINNSSIGVYPHVVRHREKQQRYLGRAKWPAFAFAVVSALRSGPTLRVKLRLDDVEHRCATSFVLVGNNSYVMEGLDVGARAHMDRGVLSVYFSRSGSRMRLLGLAMQALIGRLEEAEDFEAATAESIVIETRKKRLHVSTDGEVTVMETPLVYKTRPRALRVLVPAPQG